jgi:hypothetical protein
VCVSLNIDVVTGSYVVRCVCPPPPSLRPVGRGERGGQSDVEGRGGVGAVCLLPNATTNPQNCDLRLLITARSRAGFVIIFSSKIEVCTNENFKTQKVTKIGRVVKNRPGGLPPLTRI